MARSEGYLGGHAVMPESWKGHSDDDVRLIREGRKEARETARKKARKRKQRIQELIALNTPGNPKHSRSKKTTKVPAKGN